ncbi:MAG: right-handed parallel beta-helix repeat-containing protein [Phycisphaerae bacterium]
MSALISARTLIALLTAATFGTATAQAQTTWYVDDDAPGDPGPGDPTVSDPLEDGSAEHPFDAIQEGIDAAVDGDTVLVLDGTYTGDGNKNLDFGGKLVTVRSENGPESCIIDCEHDGRGFYFHSGETAEAVVDGFTITNGLADSGGGMYNRLYSNPTVVNCAFSENSADDRGGGMCNDYESSPTVTNCTFSGNSATNYGGGMENDRASNPWLTNCTFSGNSALSGGGLFNEYSSPMVANCTFSGNSATNHGGGMYDFDGSNPTVTNCTFSGNSAVLGGGILNYYGSPRVANCTFTGNSADYGGGMYNERNSDPMVTNCIFWGDGGGEIYNIDAAPIVTYCCVEGGYIGTSNIDADPLFADPDGPDDDPNTFEDNNYRLSAGSPCIDAADNEAVPADALDLDGDGDIDEPIPFDLDGNPRFVDDPDTDDTGNPPGADAIVDMGAYEFQVGVVAYLDMKPGSCPNPLNRRSHGVLPAAIVGNAEFDVTQIDVDTLVLTRADGVGGSVAPLMEPPGPDIQVEDVATPFEGELCDCHELEGDGIDDLSMKFDAQTVVSELQLNDLPGGVLVELVVSGELLDGTPLSATDCVRLVPPASESGSLLTGSDTGDEQLDGLPAFRRGQPDEDRPAGGSSPHDADSGRLARPAAAEPEEARADQGEDSQDAFVAPLVGCGAFSPGFLPTTIMGMCLIRRWGPRRLL